MKKQKELKQYEKILGNNKLYELPPEEFKKPISKEMGELCRHRLEKRWYRRLVILNFLIIAIIVGLFVKNISKNIDLAKDYVKQVQDDARDSIEQLKGGSDDEDTSDEISQDKDDTSEDKKIEDVPFEVKYFFLGIFIFIVLFFVLYYNYAKNRANALRITEKNFPEVYKTIEEYANRLGIAVPKAYVMQTSGVLNAFSTFLFKRQWILIHSELFEVAYREHNDMDALNFVIAHEMAHIYYGHATLHYNLPMLFTMNIPVIGATASRAREYSCDRLAQLLTGTAGIEAMLVLVVDRHIYKMVDKDDYISEMRSTKGFFVWFANLLADHPIMSKRIVALEDGRGSGRLY